VASFGSDALFLTESSCEIKRYLIFIFTEKGM